jgi:serine protease inhibitor
MGEPSDAQERPVNAWTSGHTDGMIPQIVEPADVAAAVMVLTNAVYFRGTWTDSFDPQATRSGLFHLANGGTEPVRLMTRKGSVAYHASETYEAVRLPYGRGDFAAYVLLPGPGRTAAQLVQGMTAQRWEAVLASLKPTTMHLWLPRFHVSCQAKLKDALTAMGVGSALRPGADLSRMQARPGPLWIDDVSHRAAAEVDEKGTRAAASTAVRMTKSVPRDEKVMRVDRPFVFVIAAGEEILFVGTVGEPG